MEFNYLLAARYRPRLPGPGCPDPPPSPPTAGRRAWRHAHRPDATAADRRGPTGNPPSSLWVLEGSEAKTLIIAERGRKLRLGLKIDPTGIGNSNFQFVMIRNCLKPASRRGRIYSLTRHRPRHWRLTIGDMLLLLPLLLWLLLLLLLLRSAAAAVAAAVAAIVAPCKKSEVSSKR